MYIITLPKKQFKKYPFNFNRRQMKKAKNGGFIWGNYLCETLRSAKKSYDKYMKGIRRPK